MTKSDREALRSVEPAIRNLLNECLAEAPIADIEKTLDGVHTNDMVANAACVHAGFMRFATLVQSKLKISQKHAKPQVRQLARSVEDLPK